MIVPSVSHNSPQQFPGHVLEPNATVGKTVAALPDVRSLRQGVYPARVREKARILLVWSTGGGVRPAALFLAVVA